MHPSEAAGSGPGTAAARGRAFFSCLLRSYLVGACFNTRGLQNIGFAYAMQPGLAVIHADEQGLRQARKRYLEHYHSHPFWAPCLVGIFLSVEMHIASGLLPAHALDKVKETTGYTLSAIGDSVFAGSLLVFWSLSTCCLLVSGCRAAPLFLGLFFLCGLQAFRAFTFWAGVRGGFRFLERLKHWNLINWGQRVKCLNAGLLLWLWVLVWPRPLAWWQWAFGALGMAALGKMTYRFCLPREVVIVLFLLAWALFPVAVRDLRGVLTGLGLS
ncbi:MAG: PTS system mannose/fructose/sorbose family transporter subunit IID [Desulfovibrionaceae bacterium]|nr:PTS system mannose/fructose/sorbose family transporter subunit IID [Desulfovibrionaceae bacterium]